MSLHPRFTKIICTIGPATWDPSVMKAVIENGMDVARINGAFADEEEMLKVEKLVRDITTDVAMMIDIKGAEVRLNKFSETIFLKQDDILEIGSSPDYILYPTNYPDIHKKIHVGQHVAVGDGDVRLEVVEVRPQSFLARVLYGEELKPGKALNFPGAHLHDNPLTEKDKALLKYAMDRQWEFVSASFIRTVDDARVVRNFLGDNKIELIAKIEDAEGLQNIEEILTVVDGVMVARGGLGVELGFEKVPIAQRQIISAGNAAGKPTITATQMLDRMEKNITPSRAEANDIATSILLGSDCLMLSGETSAGKYPLQAVEFMAKVDREVRPLIKANASIDSNEKIISASELDFSKQLFNFAQSNQETKAIMYFTDLNHPIGIFTRYSLPVDLFAFLPNKVQSRQMNLRRGVKRSFATEQEFTSTDDIKNYAYAVAKQLGIANTGEKVIVVSNYHSQNKLPPIFEIVTAG